MNQLSIDILDLIYKFNPITYNKQTDLFRKLKVLNNKDLTDEMLLKIRQDKIISLNLNYNENITNEGIKPLVNLTSLTLQYNENITDEGIKHLINLTILNLKYNENITNEELKPLVNLRNLNLKNNKNNYR